MLSPKENKYLIGGPSTIDVDSMLEGITNLSRVDDKQMGTFDKSVARTSKDGGLTIANAGKL